MKQITHFFIITFSLVFAFYSCSPDVSNITVAPSSSSEVDFTTYTAIGNSLTAGFANNSLYRSGQEQAYPSLLHRQFGLVQSGINAFNVPFVNNDKYPEGIFTPRLHIYGSPADDVPNVSIDTPAVNFEAYASVGAIVQNDNEWTETTPFNNLGIPSANVADLINVNFGNLRNSTPNPYYARLEAGNATESPFRSIVQRVQDNCPTFFSLWIGGNDVLGYATSGGENNAGGATITSVEDFTQHYRAVLDSIFSSCNTSEDEKLRGVLINVPLVQNARYFSLVTQNPSVKPSARLFKFEDSKGETRFFDVETDYFIATSAGAVRTYITSVIFPAEANPDNITTNFSGNFILDNNEVTMVNNAVEGYNTFISQMAEEFDLALVDVNPLLERVALGELEYLGADISGGIFSLDGVHVTPRGNALIANTILDAINSKYNTNIPKLDLLSFDGLIFEQKN